MSRLLLLLLLVGSSYAATHVNISIAQKQSSDIPGEVSYMGNEERFARLQAQPQQSPQNQQSQLSQQSQIQQQQQSQQQPQQLTPRQNLGLQPPNNNNVRMQRPNVRRGHMRRISMTQQQQLQHNGQVRQRSQQRHQNQEFERYIQSYHSHGPTVETVYESSSPAPQRYTQSSSSFASSSSSSSSASNDDSAPQRIVAINSRPKQMYTHTFERQVALPAAASTSVVQSANVEQDSKPIYEAPLQTANVASAVSSSNNPTSVKGSEVAVTSVAPNDAGSVQSNFDASTSYNKPGSYDPNTYNYDDGQDYQDQYPPAFDADSQGYDDYGEQTPYQGGGSYLPPQRGYLPPNPVVTKTIQIAQPALKAKKYEVRHPAIQKEFYDIEERVLIKPAGTLVVELDRPVAKIAKGETVLPLGHPHPAVASAYNTNGQLSGVSQTSSYNNNDYRPKEHTQTSSTVGSSVTTMPTYDQAPRDEFVESQLQHQPGHYNVEQESSRSKSPDALYITATDSNGNQAKISTKDLTPNMLKRKDESEFGYSSNPVELPPAETSYEQRPAQRNYQRNYNRQPQPQSYNDEYFSGEFLPNANSGNVEAKPARLQQAELQQEQQGAPRTHIIKHEHNIHLPPSQHNIYLGRSHQVPQERRIGTATSSSTAELPAHVSELKPFPRNPGIVYAKTAVKPAASNRVRGYYMQNSRQRNPLAEELEYSAPYSRMRYDPQDSERLVEAPKQEQKQDQGNTHIHIQIPNQNDQDKSVVVASTISPARSSKPDCDDQKSQQMQQKQFQRLVDVSSATPTTMATPTLQSQQTQPDVDVSVKGAAGHMTPNERVISATPAPTDASATSETFHKRRIVVNHPFQTVREVVEHEPITNYHQIQVNERASPALYHQAAYYQPPVQTHGNLVHYQSSSTHGNLFAPVSHAHLHFA